MPIPEENNAHGGPWIADVGDRCVAGTLSYDGDTALNIGQPVLLTDGRGYEAHSVKRWRPCDSEGWPAPWPNVKEGVKDDA